MGQIKPAPRARTILIFLMLLNILNMVDRSLIASFGPQISRDLNLTDSQFGLLTGLIFVFFYVLMGLFMGALADRVNRPRLIAAGLILWSVLTAVSGAAKNFFQIGIARLFIGIGESTMTPASMSMLSDLFPAEKRGSATGLYYLGIPLGAGGSFLVAGILGPMIGWRNCFYLLGGIGVLLSVGLLIMSDPKRGAMEPAVEGNTVAESTVAESTVAESMVAESTVEEIPRAAEKTMHWRESVAAVGETLKTNRALLWTMIGAIFLHIPLGAGQFSMLWLESERGFDGAEIATIYGIVYVVFGTAGTFFGGVLSDWYQARFKGGRLRFLALLMITIAPLTVGYRFASPESPIFYLGMCMALFSVSSFYGPAFSTVQDLTPPRLRGVMTAVLLVACNLLGLGLGAYMTGLFVEMFRAMDVATPYTSGLLVGDVIGFLTIPSFLYAAVHLERRRKLQMA